MPERRIPMKKTIAIVIALVLALSIAAASADVVYRTLDEIKASGVINIGVFSDKNPFGYVDENGEYQGYDVYFARRIGEDLGVEVNFVSTEAANRVEYLETGKVDIVLANFTVTDERAEKVDFALPYMNVALGVVSPEDAVIEDLADLIDEETYLGIRIASEEEPNFDFYTSRLGIRYSDIVKFYKDNIAKHPNFHLKMLHFFINTGIRDTAYYWNELSKCVKVYCELKAICPELDSLNIGGGLPNKTSLAMDFDYEYMVEEIINQIKVNCNAMGIEEPDIFTEFGSFTVGESGATIFKILDIKQQNDREKWYMIDNSFMTCLPDTWGLNQRFILLPINKWNDEYQRVFLGGLTCDSQDFYNADYHANAIFLPTIRSRRESLYIGFFHTGAYQEAISGYGGIKHCLQPSPKHILIDRDKEGHLVTRVFAEEQSAASMLKLLGY